MSNPTASHPTLPANGLSFDDTAVAFADKSDRDLWQMHGLFAALNQPWLTRMGTAALGWAMRLRLPVEGLVRQTIFRQFVGGESIAACAPVIQALTRSGVGTILDYSVEGEKSERGFEQTTSHILATVERAGRGPGLPFAVFKVTGVAPFALLEKRQAGRPLTPDEQETWDAAAARIDRICAAAHARGVPMLIDGEESWIQDSIDALAYEMMARYNQERTIVYNTYQMYTTTGLPKLRAAHQRAAMHGYQLGAKLVRGAYMEKERHRARANGYADPIHVTKTAVDNDFNAGCLFCLNEKQRVSLCAGTHNEYSCLYLAAAMEKHGLGRNDPRVWFAQLYGMSDNISFNLAQSGYNVAKYVPYGPVRAVLPYLMRRAAENTSVAGQSSRELTLVRRERARRRKL